MKKENQLIERPMPSSTDAEQAVLGAIIGDNKTLDDIGDVTANDFFFAAHKKIFQAIQELSNQNTVIDLVSLYDQLSKSEELSSVGGATYISKLIDGIPKLSNIQGHAKIIKEKSILRTMIHESFRVQELAFEGFGTAEEILDSATKTFLDLAIDSAMSKSVGKSFRDAAKSLIDLLTSKEVRKIRIFTDLTELDKITGGFCSGELVTLTAGTGVGKTLLAQQMRRRACRDGFHTLFCSGEMTGEHLVSRELVTQSGIERYKMRWPEHLTAADIKALVDATVHECPKCEILDGELTLQRIRIAARRKKRAGGLDCIIGDYDELIDAPGRDENTQQKNLIRGSKSIAVELGIPFIMISQLRKSLDTDEAKNPTLERLYGSGAKSKHSSFVIFVDREYVRKLEGDQTEARVCILKSRESKTGPIKAKFNLDTLRFEDAQPVNPDEPQREPKKKSGKKPKDQSELVPDLEPGDEDGL